MIRAKIARSGRIAAAVTIAALSLLLSGCLLVPGKFVSALDLRKDGQFTFTYKGEMSLVGIAQLAAMEKADKEFKPETCYDYDAAAEEPVEGQEGEDTAVSMPAERPCTAEEVADQKAIWQEDRKGSAERNKKELDQMKAVMGGLDPTDPKSIEEFATRLRRQAGWNTVTYKGDGLFDIDYAMAGRIDHDFVFPIIEKFPTTNTFVQVLRRTDGTVRIDAPGFNPNSSGNPMAQAMGMGAMSAINKGDMPKAVEIEGTFTVTTDGRILANNTEEGPQADPAGHKLTWPVSVRTTATPTALVRLGD